MEIKEDTQVVGYRKLSEKDIAVVNDIKSMAVQIGDLIKQLQSNKDFDSRWIEVGKIDVQKGFMALTRAVTQPTTF